MKNYRCLSGYNGLVIILLLATVFVFPVNALAGPATYDAGGTWLYWITKDFSSSAYCQTHSSIGFGTITQKSNGEVELALNGKEYIGIVSGAVYTFSDSYPDGQGTTYIVVQFTLTSNSSASGLVKWEYWEYGSLFCYGYDTLTMQTVASYDQPPQFFDTSGIWDYQVTSQWNDCGDTPSPRYGTTSINQNGTTFTYTDEFGIHTGLVSGNDYICTLTYPEEGGLTYEATFFELSSATSGSGSISWTWVQSDSYQCSGGGTFSLTKRTATPYYEASGSWKATFSTNPYPVDATFTQDSNTITWVNPYNKFVASGFVSDKVYTVIGSYPSNGGTMTESLIFQLLTNGDYSGEMIWTWTNGGLPTYGTIPFTLEFYGNYNTIPNKPTLTSPPNNLTNVSLTPTMMTGSFSDPDNGATHALTEWQISTRSDLASTVFQKTTDSNLTSLQVPRFTLGVGTTYYWRVRHYDEHFRASLWSNTYAFTTTFTTNDQDNDGIPDAQELPPGSDVDLDQDGTPDINQAKYKVLKDINNIPVGISHKLSNIVSSIDTVEFLDPAVVSNVARPSMPNGLLTIISTVAKPTDNGELTIYFSAPIPQGGRWYMHNPIDGWVDYSNWSVFAPNRESITIKLKDWGFGDADGIPNGRVVDPGGIGFPTFMALTVKDAFTGLIIPKAAVTIGDLTLDTANCAGDCLSMIVPGTYDITITAPGYNTVVEKTVVISEGVDVIKNFNMRPSGAGALSAILILLLD